MVVIHNPVAGRRRRRRLVAVLERLAALGCVVELLPTARHGDAERLAAAAAADRPDRLVAAGGDGTVNAVVNGLLRAPPPRPPLAVIPLGTANVLACEMGLARRPAAIARGIVGGRARPLYLGVVEGRRFVLMVGVGVDACAVAAVNARLKRHVGRLAYVAAAVRALWRHGYPPCGAVIDGVAHEARAVLVMNGRCYGGPFVPAPEAGVDRPGFQVVLLQGAGRWNAVRYGVAVVVGRLHRLRDVAVVPGRRVRITGAAGAPVQADGDIVAALPVEVTAEGPVLDLVWP